MLDRFYPETYGAVVGSAQDGAPAFARVANAISSAGGGILDVSRGLYRVDSQVNFPSVDNLVVVGSGAASGFLVTSASKLGTGLAAVITNTSAGREGSSTTVSSIAGEGTFAVAVAVPLFQPGDIVRFVINSPGHLGTQYNEVSSVGGSSVFLVRPLPFDVPGGTVIQRVTMRRGLRLEGFSVLAQNQPTEHYGLLIWYERDALVSDITTDGQGTYVPSNSFGGGFDINEGLNNRFANLSARRGGSNGQNAMAFIQQTGLQASNLRSEQGAFGIGLTSCADGQMTNLQVHRDAARAIKLYGTHHMSLSQVNTGAAAHVGFGFSEGSCNNLIVGLDIRGIQGGQSQGLWFNGNGNLRNTVLGAKIRVCPQNSVVMPQGDAHNYVQLVDQPADPIFNTEPTSKVVVLA